MSCVNRGRPRNDTATPPTITACVRVASSHFARSASGARSVCGTRSVTQCLPDSSPAIADFQNLVLAVTIAPEEAA